LRRFVAQAFEVLIVIATIGSLLLYCSIPDPRALARRNPTTTAFIELRRAEAAAHGKRFELAWQWRPIGRISRYLRAAIIYAEDYNFYRHDGVDWDAVEAALEDGMQVGASTITQQLAKNLYLSPDRSLRRKVREMFIAWKLEDALTKQRILELYLNVVEWGDGVFGAEAAARRWYGVPAMQLRPAQAARLAIALPNPIARAPNVTSALLTKKAVRIVRLLRMQGLIDATQEAAAYAELGAAGERVLPTRTRDGRLEPAPMPVDAGIEATVDAE